MLAQSRASTTRHLTLAVLLAGVFAGCWGETGRESVVDHDSCALIHDIAGCCARVGCTWLGQQSDVGPGCVTPKHCGAHASCGPGRKCIDRWYGGQTPCGQFFYSGYSATFCADFCPIDALDVNGTCNQKWNGD